MKFLHLWVGQVHRGDIKVTVRGYDSCPESPKSLNDKFVVWFDRHEKSSKCNGKWRATYKTRLGDIPGVYESEEQIGTVYSTRDEAFAACDRKWLEVREARAKDKAAR